MKVVAIVQARLSSQRLANKVLLPLEDKTVLGHIVDRLLNCKFLDEIVIATSTDASDKEIVDWCKINKINFFCGSLHDVLDRYYKASRKYNAKVIVRVTGDCPVVDPEIVDEVIKGFFSGNYDAYSLAGDFPDGLDCQVFSFSAIEKSWKEAKLPSEREHVGVFIEKTHRELFKLGELNKFTGLQNYRWTLDEPEDYEFLKKIFFKLYRGKNIFYTQDILNLIDKEPELMNINSGIVRNEGYKKSLYREKK